MRSRTVDVVHWSRLVLVGLLTLMIVSIGIAALTRRDWIGGGAYLVLAVVIVAPAIAVYRLRARAAKLSHPHPDSN